jgi:hypothetical protein
MGVYSHVIPGLDQLAVEEMEKSCAGRCTLTAPDTMETVEQISRLDIKGVKIAGKMDVLGTMDRLQTHALSLRIKWLWVRVLPRALLN